MKTDVPPGKKADLDRLRQEYAGRKTRKNLATLYSPFYQPYLFFSQQKTRVLVHALRKLGVESLEGKKILEIGCGSGGVLQEYQTLGAVPGNLFGIDLLFDRLIEAHDRCHRAGITNADGQNLPFPTNSFDIVLQYTAFSSILDAQVRQNMAAEMLRVLNQDGFIVWYDFWWNPTNTQTKGIRPAEIKELFPGCRIDLHKTTLAPPIARRIVPLSWGLAFFMESLGLLNTHYLVTIQK